MSRSLQYLRLFRKTRGQKRRNRRLAHADPLPASAERVCVATTPSCSFSTFGDDYSLNKFTYEANRYVHMLLRLHFLFWLSHNEQKANQYKEIADEIEKLSWARTNADYWEIKQATPELQQKLNISS